MEELIGRYLIVRTRDAGVHAGVLESVDGDIVILRQARRLWRWWARKSISLSGVALHGLAKRSEPRIAGELQVMAIRGWCELLPCSDAAEASIRREPEASAS